MSIIELIEKEESDIRKLKEKIGAKKKKIKRLKGILQRQEDLEKRKVQQKILSGIEKMFGEDVLKNPDVFLEKMSVAGLEFSEGSSRKKNEPEAHEMEAGG